MAQGAPPPPPQFDEAHPGAAVPQGRRHTPLRPSLSREDSPRHPDRPTSTRIAVRESSTSQPLVLPECCWAPDDRLAKGHAGPMKPRFYRARGHAQNQRRSADNRTPRCPSKPPRRAARRPVLEARPRPCPRRRRPRLKLLRALFHSTDQGLRLGADDARLAVEQGPFPAGASPVRNREVSRHAINPRIKPALLAIAVQALKRLEKSLLGQISGVLQVAANPPAGVKYPILIASDQLAITLSLSGFHLLHQEMVIHGQIALACLISGYLTLRKQSSSRVIGPAGANPSRRPLLIVPAKWRGDCLWLGEDDGLLAVSALAPFRGICCGARE